MRKEMTVGSELDSYCGKCKLELNHVVVAMVADQPRRVRCLTCQSEHNHRLQKAVEKATTTRGKRAAGKTKTTARSKWNDLIANWDDSLARPYSIYESFAVSDWIDHTKFGKGGVIDVPAPDRIITLFESGEKMLMQGKLRPGK